MKNELFEEILNEDVDLIVPAAALKNDVGRSSDPEALKRARSRYSIKV